MVAKMRNGGQACTAANRFYVDSRVAAEFTQALAERMAAVRMGDGKDPGTGAARSWTRPASRRWPASSTTPARAVRAR